MDLKNMIKKLPENPGVYLMKDAMDNIIYIGKSKNLRNRVSSYFQNNSNMSNKVKEMVGNIKSFEIFLTETEVEALLLESKLIKEKKPMYNRLLKNTKRYAYLKITIGEKFPRILSVYEKEKDKGKYFGPFSSKNTVDELIVLLKECYPIVQCSNPYNGKLCLNYHIEKCSGVCQNLISERDYRYYIDEIEEFLKGNRPKVIEDIHDKMIEASKSLDFLKAKKYRDYLVRARSIIKTQRTIFESMKDNTILALELLNEYKIMFFIIKGNLIIYKKLIKWEEIEELAIKSAIIEDLSEIFRQIQFKDGNISRIEINKDNIDEILIVSNYFKNEDRLVRKISIENYDFNTRKNLKSLTDRIIRMTFELLDEVKGRI